jgi:hypothetical protein
MNPRVIQVLALPDLKLEIKFQDGKRGLFDVSPYTHFPVFKRLKEAQFFNAARVDHGTVQWPGGIDFDPDTLYLESQVI